MFVVTFLGCYFGSLLGTITANLIKAVKKDTQKNEQQEIPKKEAPKNISSISDPLSLYEKYTDDKSKLYKPIKNKVVNRIEVGTDEDSL